MKILPPKGDRYLTVVPLALALWYAIFAWRFGGVVWWILHGYFIGQYVEGFNARRYRRIADQALEIASQARYQAGTAFAALGVGAERN